MNITAPACWPIKALWVFLLAAFFTVLPITTVRAATYYVSSSDPNASDSYATATAALPWKTIAKVNLTTILPGDTVYFKCGDIWRETLTVKSGTQTGATTTYTSYGTGAKPIISGADPVTSWTPHATGTANTYKATLANITYMVTANNTYLKKGASETALTANQYFWVGGFLYINTGTDPNFQNIEAGQRMNAISCASSGSAPKTFFYHNSVIGFRLEKTNSSNITVQSSKFWKIQNCDLFFANSAGNADGAGVNANNCDDMTVDNCHVNYALGDGIIIYNSLRAIVTNNLVENVLDDGVNHGGDCIQVEGNKGGHSTDGFQILNNVVSRPNVDVVKGCIIAQCGENGIVSGNTTSGGKFGVSVGGNYNTVSHNYVTAFGIYGGIRISRDIDLVGCTVMYNVVTQTPVGLTNNGTAAITITDDTNQHAGDPVGDSLANRSNFTISNNTFYNTYYGIIIERGGFSGKIENNISWNDPGFAQVYRLKLSSTPLAGEPLVIDRNLWQNKSGSLFILFGSTAYTTLAAWQATGYDTHSSASDPLWANPAGNDFHLGVGSPAIDTGDNLGYTEDFEGHPVPQGFAPDMGAFEYQYAGAYAYEGFNYASATVLGGLNGGSGWASTWSSTGGSGNSKTTGSTLPYTGLPSTGITLRLTGTATGTQASTRTFNRTYGQYQETYWISFLVKKLSNTLEDHIAFGGLDFRAISGNPWEVTTPATSYTTTGAAVTTTHLFLVRVDAGATSDKVRVWVDPVLSAGEPAPSTATVTLTDTPGFSFNTLRLSQSLNGDAAKGTMYDEFRTGGSFASVVAGP